MEIASIKSEGGRKSDPAEPERSAGANRMENKIYKYRKALRMTAQNALEMTAMKYVESTTGYRNRNQPISNRRIERNAAVTSLCQAYESIRSTRRYVASNCTATSTMFITMSSRNV